MTALKAAKPESYSASSALALNVGAVTAGTGLSSCICMICCKACHERDSSTLSPQGKIWPAVLPLEGCWSASTSQTHMGMPMSSNTTGPRLATCMSYTGNIVYMHDVNAGVCSVPHTALCKCHPQQPSQICVRQSWTCAKSGHSGSPALTCHCASIWRSHKYGSIETYL